MSKPHASRGLWKNGFFPLLVLITAFGFVLLVLENHFNSVLSKTFLVEEQISLLHREAEAVEPSSIACMVVTHRDWRAKKRLRIIGQSWGKQCDYFVPITTVADMQAGEIGLMSIEHEYSQYNYSIFEDFRIPLEEQSDADKLPLVFEGLRYTMENYGDKANWILIADDGLFVRTGLLREFLSTQSSSGMKYFGGTKKVGNITFVSKDAGIIISQTAAKALLRAFASPRCKFNKNVYTKLAADVNIGKCFSKLKVTPENIIDGLGRSRFLDAPLESKFEALRPDELESWEDEKSQSCCSTEFITSGGLSEALLEMYIYAFNTVNIARD
jgi:hypothetical protein